MATKRRKGSVPTLQSRVTELQKRAEKTLRRGVDRTFELLPPAPRKAVKSWAADIEKVGANLRKSADKALHEARNRVNRLGSAVQRRIERAVAPVTRSLDFASRKDIEALRRRVEQIERRLSERAAHEGHSAAA